MVQKVYEFRDGGVKEYLGGIYYFLEKRKLEIPAGDSNAATLRQNRRRIPRRNPPRSPLRTGTPRRRGN